MKYLKKYKSIFSGYITSCVVSFLFFVSPCFAKAFDQVYFRGSPNDFGLSPMSQVSDGVWEVTVNFSGKANDRFKFDIYGDWSLNYGDSSRDFTLQEFGDDIYVNDHCGSYTIRFYTPSLTYSVLSRDKMCHAAEVGQDYWITQGETVVLDYFFEVNDFREPDFRTWTIVDSPNSEELGRKYYFSAGVTPQSPGRYVYKMVNTVMTEEVVVWVAEDTAKSFESVYFRGTPNDFNATKMDYVGRNTWSIDVTFDEREINPRFKFDIHGDWSENYGDTQVDGVLDFWGDDIPVDYSGRVEVIFYADSMTYSVRPWMGFRAHTTKRNSVYRTHLEGDGLSGTLSGFNLNYGSYFDDFTAMSLSQSLEITKNGSLIEYTASSFGSHEFKIDLLSGGEHVRTEIITLVIQKEGSVVKFACHDFEPGENQGVYIVGEGEHLGNWSPTRNTRLKKDQAGLWSKDMLHFRELQTIEWKCVIARDEDLSIVSWQVGENNVVDTPHRSDSITTRGFNGVNAN